MSIKIRELDGAADTLDCLEIYSYYIENTTVTFDEETPTPEEFTDRVKRITESYPFFVADDGNRVVGFAYLDTFNPRSAYRRTADLTIYLAHNTGGRGVGTMLYTALEDAARARGIANIISLITSDNAASLAFHKKHGFDEVGHLTDVGVKFGQLLSVDFYQKTL